MSEPVIERRRRRSPDPLIRVWIGALAILVFAMARVPEAEELFLDPNALADRPWYGGVISTLGLLGWSWSVSGCLATAFVLRHGGRRRASLVFGWGGALFTVLLLDDLLQLHSGLLPRTTGLPKTIFVLLEFTAAGWWIVVGRLEILRTRWELLVCAAFALAGSAVTDFVVVQQRGVQLVLEDTLKFLGISALAVWSTVTAADLIRSVVLGSSDQRPSPVGERTFSP